MVKRSDTSMSSGRKNQEGKDDKGKGEVSEEEMQRKLENEALLAEAWKVAMDDLDASTRATLEWCFTHYGEGVPADIDKMVAEMRKKTDESATHSWQRPH
jgi:hypothetical protein